MMQRSGIDGVICFSTDPWGEMKRPGQLMRCLRDEVPILYVEPALSLSSLMKNWRTGLSAQTRARLTRALRRRPTEVLPGLHVVSSMISLPPQRLAFLKSAAAVRALADRQHRRSTRRAYRAAERMGMLTPVVWASHPFADVGSTSESVGDVLVYDCMDRWTDFPDSVGNPQMRGFVERLEARLVQAADVVFCSARGLYDAKLSTAAGRVHLLRNGADLEHFAPASRQVPDDIADLPRPIIGYVGAIAEWVDYELLRAVARLRPEWSFVFVGPVFRGGSMGDPRALEPLKGLGNVRLLGSRSYADVPSYVEAFDVAMIPFKLNGLTDDTNPIKAYEYLAAGVPVVSTRLPEMLELAETSVASDAEEFVAECEVAQRSRHDPERVSARVAVAQTNSWEARAQAAWRVILDAHASR